MKKNYLILERFPQGSILETHLFLIYVNGKPQAVESNLLLYPDDSCLMY